MKLLIDIDENEYKGIKSFPKANTSYPWTLHLYDAVRNATPYEERPSVDDVCKILSDELGTPCNYGLGGEEVSDIIPSEWCEDNCPNNEDYSICWKSILKSKAQI